MLTHDVMLNIVASIIGRVIGVLLWAALLNAPILQWRARKLKNWSIGYKVAYVVSIKAGLIAVVLSFVVQLGIVLLLPPDVAPLDQVVGFIVALSSWWLVHSNALLKLSGPHGLLSVSDARSISSNVLGFIFIVGFTASLGIFLLVWLFSLVTECISIVDAGLP